MAAPDLNSVLGKEAQLLEVDVLMTVVVVAAALRIVETVARNVQRGYR